MTQHKASLKSPSLSYLIHKERFAKLSVDQILAEDIYTKTIESCTLKDPLKCSFSLFFSDKQKKWVACCPEFWLIPVGRWAKKPKDEVVTDDMIELDIIPSNEKVRLYAKWQNQYCPFPCEEWKEEITT